MSFFIETLVLFQTYLKIFIILSGFTTVVSFHDIISNVRRHYLNINKSVEFSTRNSTFGQPFDKGVNIAIFLLYIFLIAIIVVLFYLRNKNFKEIQKYLILLLSGLLNVLSGIFLFDFKNWEDFDKIKGLLILIQPLMGLKGNLEMTMASRMATFMNIREDKVSFEQVFREITEDIILVQSQATVVSLATGIFAGLSISFNSFDFYNFYNLCAISLFTGSTACFLLGVIISIVIVISKKYDHDPDDYATPVAASIGDLATLLTMIAYVYLMIHTSDGQFPMLSIIFFVMILIFEPIFIGVSYINRKTRHILVYGWTPIILSFIISLFSGIVFDYTNSKYQQLATFQVLFNGFTGNCLALLSSRISTSLHRKGPIGTIDENFKICVTPYYVFKSKENKSSKTTTMLLIIVIPSQLLYILLISVIQNSSEFKLTIPFIVTYLLFNFIQLSLLLYLTYILSHIIWKWGYDPDMNAIPILTALADLSGTFILFFVYVILEIIGDENAFQPK